MLVLVLVLSVPVVVLSAGVVVGAAGVAAVCPRLVVLAVAAVAAVHAHDLSLIVSTTNPGKVLLQ